MIDAKITADIRWLASHFAGQLAPLAYDRQDCEQELALHFLKNQDQFDGTRSSKRTFAAHVCRNRALQLVAVAASQKRGGGVVPRSLSEPITFGKDGTTAELATTISDDSVATRTGSRSRPSADLLILRLAVRQVVETLPPALVEMANHLAAGETAGTLAHELGIARATGYRRINKLRDAFVAAGFSKHGVALSTTHRKTGRRENV